MGEHDEKDLYLCCHFYCLWSTLATVSKLLMNTLNSCQVLCCSAYTEI